MEPSRTLSHYRLIETIGRGGMGVVWKAEDTVLGRSVAVKLLPATIAGDASRRQMFFEEARLASSLNDPHIVQVYEFGREGDVDFIVMEYVDGKPLSQLLHGRPMPPEKVALIGFQVARALSRAHRKKLLHRDLKPSNILVTSEGDAKVADFGLATLFAPLEGSAEELPTVTLDANAAARDDRADHGPAGTLPYMSPEQVRGERLDARSDIFSLGVVLYEATSGLRPFAGATPSELAQEIVRARSRPVHELVPKVPLELDRIIQKALAPKAGDRYQTMDDLAVDLKRLAQDLEAGSSPSYEVVAPRARRPSRHWIVLGGVVALLAAGAAAWKLGPWQENPEVARTILVMPMEVHGQSDEADYVGSAFAEALAVNIAQSKNLNVLAVPDSRELKGGGSLELARAAAGRGAGRLLRGSLTRSGGAVSVSLSLVDTKQDRILWGTQRTEEDGSLPALATSLAHDVSIALAGAHRRLYDYPPNIVGSAAMASSPEMAEVRGALRRWDTQKALIGTQRLVERFPHEGDAYALRAYAVFRANAAGDANRDQLRAALDDLERVDPRHPTAFDIWCEAFSKGDNAETLRRANALLARDDLTPAARSWVLRDRAGAKSGLGDDAGAMADVQEAISFDPTNDYNYRIMGLYHEEHGEYEAAVTTLRQSFALSPDEPLARYFLGRALLHAGRPQEAVDLVQPTCETKRDNAYCSLDAEALGRLGKWKEAATVWGRLCADRNDAQFCALYATTLVRCGRRSEARAVATKAEALLSEPKQNVQGGAYNLACMWALEDDKQRALKFLRKWADQSPKDASGVLADDDLKSLHGNPEFEAIVAEVEQRNSRE